MRISNFVDTITFNNTIHWKTFEQYKVSEKDLKSIERMGHDDAVSEKYCDYLNKYNKEQFTKEEIKFIQKVKEDVNDTREAIGRILSDVESKVKNIINKLDSDKNFSLTKLTSKYEHEFSLERDSLIENLRTESNSIIGKTKQLRHFRVRNDLMHRDASFPKSKVYFWGILFVVLLAEAFANSYFYAQGSDLGLLGGVLQATLIAIANVALSFFLGFWLFRYAFNHVSGVKKTFAWIGVMITLSILGFLHLVTAHYRELLITYPDDATQKVLYETWNHPFNISDMDSLILIIIGVTISIVVMWKAYHYDDPYPGYGDEWRRWEKSLENRSMYVKDYKNNLNILVESFGSDIDRLNSNLQKTTNELESIISGLDGFQKTVDAYNTSAFDAASEFSNTYRKAYNEVADKEALLSGDYIKHIIEEYLGLDQIKKEVSAQKNNINSYKNDYLTMAGKVHAQKKDIIENMKRVKDKLTDEKEIKILIEQSLVSAKKSQSEIGNIDE